MEFTQYLEQQGTHHEFSLAGRSSTNSRIEDKIRRLLEATCAAMITSGCAY